MRFTSFFRLFSIIIISTLLSGLSGSAFAFDAATYVEKLQKAASERGAIINFSAIDPVGDAGFVLTDVTIQGPSGNTPARIGTLRLENIEEFEDNTFAAGLVVFKDFLLKSTGHEGKEVIVSIEGGKAENIYFADIANPDAPFIYYPKTTYGILGMAVSIDGVNVMTTDSIISGVTADQNKMTFDAGIHQISVNLEFSDNAKLSAGRKALGYDKLLADIIISGSWDMKTGKFLLDNYSIDVKDVGKMSMSVALSGYTEELAKRFRAISAEMQLATSQKERQRKSIAIMGMLSQLSLDNMSLSYNDSSLVDRVLSLQAQQMGMPKDDLIKMIPAMLPIVAAPLQNPEFIGALAGNLAKFLNQPGDISIRTNPGRSIPLTEIMAAGATQPHTLIDLLGIEVVTNEGK